MLNGEMNKKYIILFVFIRSSICKSRKNHLSRWSAQKIDNISNVLSVSNVKQIPTNVTVNIFLILHKRFEINEKHLILIKESDKSMIFYMNTDISWGHKHNLRNLVTIQRPTNQRHFKVKDWSVYYNYEILFVTENVKIQKPVIKETNYNGVGLLNVFEPVTLHLIWG